MLSAGARAHMFQKGVSGNPGGRPKGNPEVKALLRENSLAAAKKLIELMNCGRPSIELAVVQEILNRTEGKPIDSVKMDVTSGGQDMRGQIREILKERFNGSSRLESTD